MAEKDPETEKLELSLFGKKKRRNGASAPPPPESASAESASESTPAGSTPAESTSAESTPAGSAPAEPAPVGSTAAESAPAPETPPQGTEQPPADRAPAVEDRPEPTVETEPVTQSVTQPVTQPVTRPEPEATQMLGAPDEPAAAGNATRGPRRRRGSRIAPPAARRSPNLPSLGAQVAALVVGAVIGLAAVVLTFVSLVGCELVTGTDSCGGPGLLVLLVVVVLMVLGGSALLRMFGVQDSGGLSFLGVAMFVALCLVALLPSLLEPWMIIVAPILCALTFGVAHWIVSRFDEEILEEEQPELHDVR